MSDSSTFYGLYCLIDVASPGLILILFGAMIANKSTAVLDGLKGEDADQRTPSEIYAGCLYFVGCGLVIVGAVIAAWSIFDRYGV